MVLIGKTLRLFLDSIGRREEYEFYLDRFSHADTPAFAMVRADAECIQEALDILRFDLEFLMRLELVPVVLTTPEAFAAAPAPHRDAFTGLMAQAGADPAESAAFIRTQAARHRIPILLDPRPLSASAAAWMPATARRLHVVRTRGALRTPGGEPLPYYYTRRRNKHDLAPEDAGLFEHCRQVVEQLDGIHVSVTSPIQLLRELFTVRGAGTMIRRGSRFVASDRLSSEQEARLAALLADSFGREIVDLGFLQAIDQFIIEAQFRAAALVERHETGAYLSKFAVGAAARGEGVAQELWQEVTDRYPRLFWRARERNPIANWYTKQADGRHRWGEWIVFWRGIPFGDIPGVIEFCARRPDDFRRSGLGPGI